MDTPNGSFDVLARIVSSPISSKEFNLKSLPTSNKERLETLNITLMSRVCGVAEIVHPQVCVSI